jgi:hypothetical protein
MDLSNYDGMDPAMLYSLVNMKLRNDYADLQDFLKSEGLDATGFLAHMRQAGFDYDPDTRQFR